MAIVKSIIATKDVQALAKYIQIHNDKKRTNKNGTLTVLGHLQAQYPTIEQFNTIPFNCNDKRTLCLMPIEHINADNI